jgi:hypothetical protein
MSSVTITVTVNDTLGASANASALVSTSSTYPDGSANAPAGSPQMPSLLSGYVARAPWEVAGVDYAVGIPSGTVLKNPSTISMAGVSVSGSVVTVTGNNVTLNGYDFSLNGGWQVYISGASNTVIENSKFLVGSNNHVPIQTNGAASNLTVQYNIIDGGGTTSNGNANNIWALIYYLGVGAFTAKYNLFTNAPGDAIDFSSNSSLNPTVEYNLITNLGTQSGAHPDFVQFVGGAVNNTVVAFNTVYEPPTATGGMEGIQIDAQVGGTITNTNVTNNTIIAPMGAAQGDTMSYLIAIQIGAKGETNNIGTVANNYVDKTGAWGVFYPIAGTNYTVSSNVDMTTGKTVGSNNSET